MARGDAVPAVLLVAAAAVPAGVGVAGREDSGVLAPPSPATGLTFFSARDFAEAFPQALVAVNQRDAAYGSTLTVLTPPSPVLPPGAPVLLGVAAALLVLAAVLLRRPRAGRLLGASGVGVLGATALLVGLTGSPVRAGVLAGGTVLGLAACTAVHRRGTMVR